MLAAIATWVFDDDGDDDVVTVSVRLGDVEPDVRLYITNPASTENGAALPLVGI